MPNVLRLKAEADGGLLTAVPGAQITTDATNTPRTLPLASFAGSEMCAILLTANLAGAGTLVTPNAEDIANSGVQAGPGTSWYLKITNASAGAFAWTLTAGTGVTLNGTMSIAQNTWREFICTVTSAKTVTVTTIGTGTYS